YENIHIILLLMNIHKISRLIVVENNKPLGIVTIRDLLPVSFLFRRDKSPSILSKKVSSKYLEQRYIPTRLTSMLVAKDVMMKEPITVSDKTDLADAAKIMTRNGISGLPVVNSNNKLVGIITKTDIVKALDKILDVR
ncbi:MAG TPA: CBS domain-containing protein, partial [Nitrososphaeraceae archaeon]|nr:CBS domain-containing protein [Nitrososphaeraceae archaeon]